MSEMILLWYVDLLLVIMQEYLHWVRDEGAGPWHLRATPALTLHIQENPADERLLFQARVHTFAPSWKCRIFTIQDFLSFVVSVNFTH